MEFYGHEYDFGRSKDNYIKPGQFELHNHYGRYEIYIFMKGDADFVVEGTVYPLRPYDILLMNPNEFHHTRPKNTKPYERMVYTIDRSFFTTNSCEEYLEMFENRRPGEQNLIPSEFVKSHDIPDIINRSLKYSEKENSEILSRYTILELLNELNKYKQTTSRSAFNAKVAPIINYINDNLSSPLFIDDIAEKFFLDKYYLCRLFKKHTGLTINKYITHKRIILVRNLYADGKTLSQASQEAGFGNYSNFYKMYVKETGMSPRESMKALDI